MSFVDEEVAQLNSVAAKAFEYGSAMGKWLLFMLAGLAGAAHSAPKHGTWVYKMAQRPLVEVDANGEKLLAFARRNQLTELYLSTGAAPLDHPQTPQLLRQLKKNGLRVEALLSSPHVERAVEEVLHYNRSQSIDARFDGVHYDYEPWIGTGKNQSWAPQLLKTYQSARRTLKGTHLTFAADISAAKLASLPQKDRAALLEAASVLVLMAYEVSEAVVFRRLEEWLGAEERHPGKVMIAIRVRDFKEEQGPVLNALEKKYGDSPHYAGWATFSYNDHLNPTICPGNGCTLLPSSSLGGKDKD